MRSWTTPTDSALGAPSATSAPPRRWRDVLATIPIVLLVPALLAPFGSAGATAAPVLVSRSYVASLATSGTAWSNVLKAASGSVVTPNLANQDDRADTTVLAKALVAVATGDTAVRREVIWMIEAAIGTEAGARTLALGRNLPGYVIAADLIDLGQVVPTFDQDRFRPWLERMLSRVMADGKTLRQIHETRPNNWGTHAGAARVAIAAYLGDASEMARAATVFRGWLGDRGAYAGFKFGSTSWQCDPTRPVAVNPAGCARNGVEIGGALPDEMRRGGDLAWPPKYTSYAWEGMQGAVLQAAILDRHGYDAWAWSDRALLRAAKFLVDRAAWPATGDDRWQPWLVNAAYGTAFAATSPTTPGKNFGWADWLYPR